VRRAVDESATLVGEDGFRMRSASLSFAAVEERMANQVGKRYVCSKCNTEMIVTKGGSGALSCCNQPMTLKS
jgi:hypothetical protein